jgi:hypothetical protein
VTLHQPLSYRFSTLSPRHNTPRADHVVGVSGEQSLAIRAPGQRNTLRLTALLANGGELGLELVNLALLLQVENDDAAGGGSAEPVAVGGEDKSVDLVTSVQRVQVLRLVQVPEHGGSILATGSAKGSVGGDGDGVDVAGVTDVVGLKTAGRELPDLTEMLAQFQGSLDRHNAVRVSVGYQGNGEKLSHGLFPSSEVANTISCKTSCEARKFVAISEQK